MLDSISVNGAQVTARTLVRGGYPSSWPDVQATDVNGALIRWQYATAKGPCSKLEADRLLIPFAHGRIPKGTELRLA